MLVVLKYLRATRNAAVTQKLISYVTTGVGVGVGVKFIQVS